MITHTCDVALEWMSGILRERMHDGLRCRYIPDENRIALSMAGAGQQIFIECTSDFSPSALERHPPAEWNPLQEEISLPGTGKLPAPGVVRLDHPIIERLPNGDAILRYDILHLAFWMMARIEELGDGPRDEHERFPASQSLAYKHAFLERPLVDEWIEVLRQITRIVWPAIALTESRFRIDLSHDVDAPSRYVFQNWPMTMRAVASDLAVHRDLPSALYGLSSRFRRHTSIPDHDRYNTFDWFMDTSESIGEASTFYFISGQTSPNRDADYRLDHPAIADLMKKIVARGHRIGLHPSYNTFDDPAALSAEARTLRARLSSLGIMQEEIGSRMHYLRWKYPDTLVALERAGLVRDATLSFADHPGFRCGTCFAYQGLDPLEGRILDLRLHPLIAMECTITDQRYLGLGLGQEAFDKFAELKDACRKVNGTFSLLWHNTRVAKPEERALYASVVNQ